VSARASFREASAETTPAQVPLCHLSLELGHLYMDDFAQGPAALDGHFRRVRPWVEAAHRSRTSDTGTGKTRISTCFLIDDYFTRFESPATVIPALTTAAAANGLTIDYVVRESACAVAGEMELAELVVGHLVTDPVPGTTGTRPPAFETGWLCNGARGPAVSGNSQAMRPLAGWQPPRENGRNRHSIFLDVELWDEVDGRRRWSCPLLAAVWQLLRLGLLRHRGRPVVQAEMIKDGGFPEDWDDLPPLTKINAKAQPFAGYRTLSVLAPRFLPVEHAVTTILSQVMVNPDVEAQVRERASAEGQALPDGLVERIEYLFAGGR
jgi:hypothetical protein